jgi:histone acetyltransferase
MEERLEHGFYTTPKPFIDDFKLIFSNCRLNNDATTVYFKCVVKLEKYV